jgi:hypothetical protein
VSDDSMHVDSGTDTILSCLGTVLVFAMVVFSPESVSRAARIRDFGNGRGAQSSWVT